MRNPVCHRDVVVKGCPKSHSVSASYLVLTFVGQRGCKYLSNMSVYYLIGQSKFVGYRGETLKGDQWGWQGKLWYMW